MAGRIARMLGMLVAGLIQGYTATLLMSGSIVLASGILAIAMASKRTE